MHTFDNSAYEAEAKRRWGDTAVYAEYVQRDACADATADLMAVFAAFASCRAAGESAADPKAQSLVKRLQEHITAHFYTCTDAILVSLGQMYVEDERFRQNIDQYGDGTAAYAATAIEIYCEK